jgi:putative ABC transport system permease protein
MLFTIAWRNIWRNKKRSAILICAIAFGLWASLFSGAIMYGMLEQMVNSAISTRTADIQIHQKGFESFKEIGLIIPDGTRVLSYIRMMPEVTAASGRSVVSGMAGSATTASGVVIYGIVPEAETLISDIFEQMTGGSYFQGRIRNPVIIGEGLAKKLEVKTGSKIVLTAQETDGSIGQGAFRIVGVFKTVSSQYDKTTVFALKADINRIFNLGDSLQEIAIKTRFTDKTALIAAAIKNKFPALDIATWQELEPELALSMGMTREMLYIFLIIVLLAMVFGITNTMLMSVIERIRELGMLISLGMKHGRMFTLITLESVFLSIIGAVVGIGLGVATIAIFAETGIDLSFVSSGLAAFGMSQILYPFLPITEYPIMVALVIITAILAAVYPAIKAATLKPVEALKTY